MGRRNQAEMKAFTTAERTRMELIGQLEKCNSYDELAKVLRTYDERKKKHYYALPSNLTEYHRKCIESLNNQIKQLIDKKSKLFSPSLSVQAKIQEPSHRTAPEETRISSTDKPATLEPSCLESEAKKQQYLDNTSTTRHVPLEDKTNTSTADQHTVRQRQQNIVKVRAQLKVIHAKQKELEAERNENIKKGNDKEAEKYKNAADAAKNIYEAISRLSKKYIQDGDLESFKSASETILDEDDTNVKALQEHRGWKLILANLAAFICTAGIAHIGYSLYKGSFVLFEPPTDSIKKVTELHESINAIELTA